MKEIQAPVNLFSTIPPETSVMPSRKSAVTVSPLPTDGVVLERGRPELNRAATGVTGPGNLKQCACGNCPQCAARAYASQARNVPGSQGEEERTSPMTVSKDNADRGEVERHGAQGTDSQSLSETEQRLIANLRRIDQKVRDHERAHLSAAGPYARGKADFTYKRGPDGRNYAVGGEVSIDTSKESTPQATITKMNIVRRAALAPVDPSPQDRKVSFQASAAILRARVELRNLLAEEAKANKVEFQQKNEEGSAPVDENPEDIL